MTERDLPAIRRPSELDRQDDLVIDGEFVEEQDTTTVRARVVDYELCPHCRGRMPAGAYVLCWHCGRGLWGDWYAEGGVINGVAYGLKNLVIEGTEFGLKPRTASGGVVVVVPRQKHGELISIRHAEINTNPRIVGTAGSGTYRNKVAQRMRMNDRWVIGAAWSPLAYSPVYEDTRNIGFGITLFNHTDVTLYPGEIALLDWTSSFVAWKQYGVA